MEDNYYEQYFKIVKNIDPPEYTTPDEQGAQIEKCNGLKPINEIEYSDKSKIEKPI